MSNDHPELHPAARRPPVLTPAQQRAVEGASDHRSWLRSLWWTLRQWWTR